MEIWVKFVYRCFKLPKKPPSLCKILATRLADDMLRNDKKLETVHILLLSNAQIYFNAFLCFILNAGLQRRHIATINVGFYVSSKA